MRFGVEDVEPGSRGAPLSQSLRQGCLIHYGAPRGVDEQRRRLHPGQLGGPDEVLGSLGLRHVAADRVRCLQQGLRNGTRPPVGGDQSGRQGRHQRLDTRGLEAGSGHPPCHHAQHPYGLIHNDDAQNDEGQAH